MKRLILLLLLASLVISFAGCGKKPAPPQEQPVVTEPVPEPETKPVPEPTPEPVIIKAADFKIVYYDFNKFNLVDSAKTALENNAGVMKNNPSVMIKIEGHCDERGTVEYNLSLGEKRAAAAMNYLTDLGIASDRIETISYGRNVRSIWAIMKELGKKIVGRPLLSLPSKQ